MTKKLLVTVQEVAEMLSMSPRQVWRLVSAGKLPQPKRQGSMTRWRSSEIEEWAEQK